MNCQTAGRIFSLNHGILTLQGSQGWMLLLTESPRHVSHQLCSLIWACIQEMLVWSVCWRFDKISLPGDRFHLFIVLFFIVVIFTFCFCEADSHRSFLWRCHWHPDCWEKKRCFINEIMKPKPKLWRHIPPRMIEFSRSRPNWIMGPGPKSEPAGKSESRGPENWVSRWRRPNSDIYSQNHHFGLVYDMIYQFLDMEAKNYKFGMFCQQCHPSVASGDADIRPRNASRIHTCHLFTS